MLRFSSICDRPAHLRALTGLPIHQFLLLAHRFDTLFLKGMKTETLDGYRREGRAYTTYVNCPLPTAEDKLLFILTYLKQNTTQAVQGQLFGMTQSNVSKWYRILATVLNTTLHSQHLIPARTCEELKHMLLQATTSADDANELPQSVDAAATTEASGPFFIMMVPNVP